MNREALKQTIVEAIQRAHGYTQSGVGETVMAAIEAHRLPPKSKCRLYIAGPMTGLPDLNFPTFHAEAARLRRLGYEVVNPAEINADPTAGWADCMKADIAELVFCDGVVLLPGWEQSRGATFEREIAERLGIAVKQACEVAA